MAIGVLLMKVPKQCSQGEGDRLEQAAGRMVELLVVSGGFGQHGAEYLVASSGLSCIRLLVSLSRLLTARLVSWDSDWDELWTLARARGEEACSSEHGFICYKETP